METVLEQNPPNFVDRRVSPVGGRPNGTVERRQFIASPNEMRPDVAELAEPRLRTQGGVGAARPVPLYVSPPGVTLRSAKATAVR